MNDLSNEIFRWKFNKMTPQEWSKKIMEEVSKSGEIPNLSAPSFFTLSDVQSGKIDLKAQRAVHGNRTSNIWSGISIKVQTWEESYIKIKEMIGRGSNQVTLIPSEEIIRNKGLIQLLKKLSPDQIRVIVDFTHINQEVILPAFQEELWKTIFEENITGAIYWHPDQILTWVKEAMPYLENYPLQGFQPFNIHLADRSLGEILSIVVSCIEMAEALPYEKIFSYLELSLNIHNDYFYEISKARALQFLLAQVVKLYTGGKIVAPLHLNAIILHEPKEEIDHWEVLKASTRTMSAIVGGYHSLTMRCQECVGNKEMESALAHIPLILTEESGFGQVEDPAAGAYYVESKSKALAEEGWNSFSQIESQGGYLTL